MTLSLMTPCRVRLEKPGEMVLSNPGFAQPVRIRYNADKLTATPETISLTDKRLVAVWGDHITLILLRAVNTVREDTWTLRIGQE